MPISKKIVHIKGKLTAGDISCDGLIESCSEDRVYMSIPSTPQLDRISNKPLQLSFSPYTDDVLSFNCEVQWSYRIPPHELTSTISIKIKDADPQYEKFYKSL